MQLQGNQVQFFSVLTNYALSCPLHCKGRVLSDVLATTLAGRPRRSFWIAADVSVLRAVTVRPNVSHWRNNHVNIATDFCWIYTFVTKRTWIKRRRFSLFSVTSESQIWARWHQTCRPLSLHVPRASLMWPWAACCSCQQSWLKGRHVRAASMASRCSSDTTDSHLRAEFCSPSATTGHARGVLWTFPWNSRNNESISTRLAGHGCFLFEKLTKLLAM